MKIALVHDTLTQMGDREKILLAFMELFQGADLFTLAYEPERMDPAFRLNRIQVSPIQSIPFWRKNVWSCFPLFGEFMGRFDLSDYDLVISSSAFCAKWVKTAPQAIHVCYCHTPFRAIWGLEDSIYDPLFFSPSHGLGRIFLNYLRKHDQESNGTIAHFMTSSTEVQSEVRDLYGREAEVFFPPVDMDRFRREKTEGKYFLLVSGPQPTKQDKQVIGFMLKLKKPLRVLIRGKAHRDWERLKGESLQMGPVVESKMPDVFSQCKGLICTHREISRILVGESLAAGCPLLVGNNVGLADIFTEGETGLRVSTQDEGKFSEDMKRFEGLSFDPALLRRKVDRFSKQRFMYRTQVYFRRLFGIPVMAENERL